LFCDRGPRRCKRQVGHGMKRLGTTDQG